MNRKKRGWRTCGCLLLWPTLSFWACLGLFTLGGADGRQVLLRLVGFSPQGDVESYWARQATPERYFSPHGLQLGAAPAPVLAVQATLPPANPQVPAGYRPLDSVPAGYVPIDPPSPTPVQVAAAAPVSVAAPQVQIQNRASQWGSDGDYDEFVTVYTDPTGQAVAVYEATENDFDRACQFIPELCNSDFYHYSHTDLGPGGAIIYGDALIGDQWREVGVVMTIEGDHTLKLGGVVMDGEVYRIPDSHPLLGQLDSALAQANVELAQLNVVVNGDEASLQLIQIRDNRLTVVFR